MNSSPEPSSPSLPSPYLAKLLWLNGYYDGMLTGIAELYTPSALRLESLSGLDGPQKVYLHCRNLYMYPEHIEDIDSLPDDARKYAEEAMKQPDEMIEFPTVTPAGTPSTGTLEYMVDTDGPDEPDPLDAYFLLTKDREYDVHVLPDDVLEAETADHRDFQELVGKHNDYNENYQPFTGNPRMQEYYQKPRDHRKLWEYPKLPIVLSTPEILMKRG